jgi:GNAT superfamily N-acetyltransferase
VEDDVLTDLHRLAFGTGAGFAQPWRRQLERHSLTWIGAFQGDALIGFVNVAWDGATHAFLLDTAVRPDAQGRGVGRLLVRAAAAEAAAAGCRWLHVDYEPSLEHFYLDHCGFQHTAAGILPLG